MPQLMPLFWVMSSIMFVLLMLMMVDIYFNYDSMVYFQSINNNKLINNWWW